MSWRPSIPQRSAARKPVNGVPTMTPGENQRLPQFAYAVDAGGSLGQDHGADSEVLSQHPDLAACFAYQTDVPQPD